MLAAGKQRDGSVVGEALGLIVGLETCGEAEGELDGPAVGDKLGLWLVGATEGR